MPTPLSLAHHLGFSRIDYSTNGQLVRKQAVPALQRDHVQFGNTDASEQQDLPDPMPPSKVLYVRHTSRKTLKLRKWLPDPQKTPPVEAPIVLVVHSLGGRTRWMSPLVKRLMNTNSNFHYYGLDIPYVGAHPYKKGHLSNGQKPVKQVLETIDYLSKKHNRKVYVAGLSIGGLFSTHAAIHQPENLGGVIAISPGYFPSDRIVNKNTIRTGIFGEKSIKATLRDKLPYPFKSKDFKPKATKKSKGFGAMRPSDNDQTRFDELRTELQHLIRREKSSGDNKVTDLTIRSYYEITKLMLRLAFGGAKKINTPYRLYLTDTDDVINPLWAKDRVFPKIGSNDKRVILFEDAEHDFNTHPAINDVAKSIGTFLNQMEPTSSDEPPTP